MAKMTDEYRRDTRLVRTGLGRSQFQETSEAMFLNSGYVYDSAEEAAAAFAGKADRFVYSRYGNPTVSMLQTRLAALEGAEACLATGNSTVDAALEWLFEHPQEEQQQEENPPPAPVETDEEYDARLKEAGKAHVE